MRIINFLTSLFVILVLASAVTFLTGASLIYTAPIFFAISLIRYRPDASFFTVTSNVLIGRSRGSIGNATMTGWKGLNVLKSKAVSVANPRTGSQLAQRDGFKQTVKAFRAMPSLVDLGYKKMAVHMSQFNAFASQMLKNGFDFSTPPIAVIQPDKILVSKGTIGITPITTAVADRSLNAVTITFPATIDQPGQSLNDIALVGIYNATLELWAGGTDGALRSSGTSTLVLPAPWNVADDVFFYLGFSSPLSGDSSDSLNQSGVIVA